jgi:hypothetical protein
VDDDGWLRYRPIELEVTATYKPSTSHRGIYAYDWPQDEQLSGFIMRQTYEMNPQDDGILLLRDFRPQVLALPLVTHLGQLASNAPHGLTPATVGNIHDWFALDASGTRSSLFHGEEYSVTELLVRVETHLGPPH